ncbi:MAG: hypothetical protein AAFO69_00740 [Bacteroidota bacterium]
MRSIQNGTDDTREFDEVYEAHLFEYVLKHVSKDPSLEPRVYNAISMHLFENELYAEYYGKVQQLFGQGLFNDSFSYADFLSSQETEITSSEEVIEPSQAIDSVPQSSKPVGKQVSMNVFLSAVASLVLAFSIALIFSQQYNGDIKLLGSSGNANTISLDRLSNGDLEIKHNSVLLKEAGDMKQCMMQLVFKGITDDGFIARSKNLGKGDEDPFLEDLEVRFPDSGRNESLINSLKDSLRNRQFPEFYVQGIHVKPKQRLHSFNNMAVLLINDIVPVENAH